jgi:hypothetical protein
MGMGAPSTKERTRMTTIRKLLLLLGFAAACLLADSTRSDAKDLCINPYIRLSRFKIPAPGQCLPAAGTYFDTYPSTPGHHGIVSGTVCMHSDRSNLRLMLTIGNGTTTSSIMPYFQLDIIDISFPGFLWTLVGRTPDAGPTLNDSGSAAYCSGVSIP